MKVKVTVPFRDKFNITHIYQVGEVLDFPMERAHDIVDKGLAEPTNATKPRGRQKKTQEAE